MFQWLHTVSFFHAAFEALAVNELRYLQLMEYRVSGLCLSRLVSLLFSRLLSLLLRFFDFFLAVLLRGHTREAETFLKHAPASRQPPGTHYLPPRLLVGFLIRRVWCFVLTTSPLSIHSFQLHNTFID